MRRLLLALALLAWPLATGAAPVREGYRTNPAKTCDGYPRAPIETAKGICAGLVFGPPPAGLRPSQRVLRLPRTLLPLADGGFLVTDLGSWEPGHGSVWRLTPKPGGAPQLTRLLNGLDLPHTVARGPDGRVYVGEMSRIVRFDPDAADPQASLEPVVTGLPSNQLHDNRHPLSSFLFDADGALLVNVGAQTDQCPPKAGEADCGEAEGERPHAAIWRFAYRGAGVWSDAPEVFASGLRNSLAMARSRAGLLLQAENSIDVTQPYWPAEEVNVLQRGGRYGWPYCVGLNEPAPAWRGKGPGCAGAAKPVLLLPPHGAPLSLTYYDGAMFPELAGRLIVALHGFRSSGSRLLAFATDAGGRPTPTARAGYWVYGKAGPSKRPYGADPAADGLVLTPGWNAVKGLRPDGAPVGVAVAADGAIWVAEDRNGAILRFARETRGASTPAR